MGESGSLGSRIGASDVLERHILLVEDDPGLTRGLCDALLFEGYRVSHTESGQRCLELLERERPDCMILDLMLPDLNGYQICERARSAGWTMPIMMMTARGLEADKIRGLDVGADDYVTKPFSVGEVLARIRALLRRGAGADPAAATFDVGGATIDTRAHQLTRDGATVEISLYETALLSLLWARRGTPVSREEILQKVWGTRANPTNRTVDNFVVKLRKKIEPAPEKPRHIITVYGFGYKLQP